MNILIELSIAFRYLQSKTKEKMISVTAILSLVGITIGVAALIVVISVMNGYRKELSEKLKGFSSDIVVSSYENRIDNYHDVVAKISAVDGVKSVIPIVQSQVLVSVHNETRGMLIKAVDMENLSKYPALSRGNTPASLEKEDGILIGYSLLRSIGVKQGESIKLVSPEFNSTILGSVPRSKEFIIEGFFRSGVSDYDSSYAFIPMDIGQKFFNLKGAVNKIEIFLQPDYDLSTATHEIRDILKDDFIVNNWQGLNYALFNALKTERVVMFLILTLIILVAVFNIISSLTMLVIERTKEIAILRTIGFSKYSVMRVFLICGMILGLSGTIFGAALGLLIAYNINTIKDFLSHITGTNLFDPIVYYLEFLPSHVDITDIVKIVSIAAVFSLLATIYPSYKASRMEPARGIKND